MRVHDEQQEGMYSYISPEKRVPSGYPLHRMRGMVDTALKETSPQFAEMYSHYARSSIAPEKLLRVLIAAGALQRAPRAAADGAAGLSPAVPLVFVGRGFSRDMCGA